MLRVDTTGCYPDSRVNELIERLVKFYEGIGCPGVECHLVTQCGDRLISHDTWFEAGITSNAVLTVVKCEAYLHGFPMSSWVGWVPPTSGNMFDFDVLDTMSSA